MDSIFVRFLESDSLTFKGEEMVAKAEKGNVVEKKELGNGESGRDIAKKMAQIQLEAQEEKDKRAQDCKKEIDAALKKYNCMFKSRGQGEFNGFKFFFDEKCEAIKCFIDLLPLEPQMEK